MRYLSLEEVLYLHRRLLEMAGGRTGIRDLGALRSALAQPRMTFGAADLYVRLEEKAATLAYSLVLNHPFVDGNKRVGHAAMATMLRLNGRRIIATVDEQESLFLGLAAGAVARDELVAWVDGHTAGAP